MNVFRIDESESVQAGLASLADPGRSIIFRAVYKRVEGNFEAGNASVDSIEDLSYNPSESEVPSG
jgi:hypothetical protein